MKNKYKIVIIIIALLLIISVYFFIKKSLDEKCLTVYTVEDIETPNLNDNILFLDDDFYLNNCETDSFDCSDFCSQNDAQKIYNECYNFGGKDTNYVRDINNLDKDNDGIACETLKI